MKVKSFLLGLLAMTAIVACEEEIQVTPKLDLGSETLAVAAAGEDVTFTVTSNVDWTATSDKEWAIVNPASGEASEEAVTVTVEVGANDAAEARTAVITVTAGALVKTVTINQSAAVEENADTWYVAGGFNEWSTTASPMTLADGWYVLTDVAVNADGFKFLKNSSWDVNITADATIVPNVKYAALDGQGKGNTFVDPLGTYDLYLSETLDSLCVMTPGLKPGEKPSTGGDVTLDGKQWVFTWNLMETQAVFDFGVTTPGVCWLGVTYDDMWVQYIPMGYQIVPTDATSGVININAGGEEMALPYSELTENTVSIAATDFLYEDVTCTLAESFIVLEENGSGGGEPSGAIEDGQYWIVEGTIFAEPKPADVTYGYLPSSEGVENGGSLASLASNAFTFTYIADWGFYVIQDCHGRYLGQGYNAETDELYNSFDFATSLPANEEEMGFYLWTIDTPCYGNYNEGELEIYNEASYYSICYDPEYKTWALYDAYEEDTYPGYPTLIKADNPVESLPEPEPSVVEATIAEFLAAAESSDVWYQLTGTITNIANDAYGNFTIEDETGEVYVYGLTAKQVASNDKSFSTLGLGVNDVVTLIGTRASYNNNPQVGGPAYYVSHVDNPDPVVEGVELALNSSASTWTEATHDIYGAGFSTTIDGFNVAYYQGKSTTTPIAPKDSQIRVYQDSYFVLSSADGKAIKSVKISTADGKTGGITVGDETIAAATVLEWTGSTTEFVAYAVKQVRISKVTVLAE